MQNYVSDSSILRWKIQLTPGTFVRNLLCIVNSALNNMFVTVFCIGYFHNTCSIYLKVYTWRFLHTTWNFVSVQSHYHNQNLVNFTLENLHNDMPILQKWWIYILNNCDKDVNIAEIFFLCWKYLQWNINITKAFSLLSFY